MLKMIICRTKTSPMTNNGGLNFSNFDEPILRDYCRTRVKTVYAAVKAAPVWIEGII